MVKDRGGRSVPVFSMMRNPAKPARPTRRPGEVRNLVSALLEQARLPLSAYDLRNLAVEAHQNLHTTQVYRALGELIAEGKALRIETLNAFCKADCKSEAGPRAVSICTTCGEVQQVEMRLLDTALKQLFGQQGFALDNMVVEGSGHCARCRSLPPSA